MSHTRNYQYAGGCDRSCRKGTVEIISDLTFKEEAVLLDGKHFRDCTLELCELTYAGGAVIFERTQITGCHYMFGGQARRTVDLLRVMGLLAIPFSAEMDALAATN